MYIKFCYVQLSAIITWSNLSWYDIWHSDNSSRNWIRFKNYNRHITGQLWGVYCWGLGEYWLCVITAPYCIHIYMALNLDKNTLKTGSHYSDIIMSMMASQITSLTIVHSTVYFSADQRKHQSSTSLTFVRGIHQWPVNSLHKWPVMQKRFPFDDIIFYMIK